MSESSKDTNKDHQPPPPEYGTFYPPPPVVTGFPQPVPPPGLSGEPPVDSYVHGYRSVPGYTVAKGRPLIERCLPCCGIGIGWFLFITGFFFAAIPWYLGAFILLCAQHDQREKPGYVACVISAILGTIAVAFGVTNA